MSVIIHNLGPLSGEGINGVHRYEVKINNYPAIAYFEHKRSHGLSACLRQAAEAVDVAERDRR